MILNLSQCSSLFVAYVFRGTATGVGAAPYASLQGPASGNFGLHDASISLYVTGN